MSRFLCETGQCVTVCTVRVLVGENAVERLQRGVEIGERIGSKYLVAEIIGKAAAEQVVKRMNVIGAAIDSAEIVACSIECF